FARRHPHERPEIPHELCLVVILPVDRRAPFALRREHELGEAAQESLAAQQQLGREAEVTSAETLERTLADVQSLAEFGDAGDVRVAQGGLAGENLSFLRRRARRVLHEIIVYARRDPVLVAAGIFDDPENWSEKREGFMRGAIDRPVS